MIRRALVVVVAPFVALGACKDKAPPEQAPGRSPPAVALPKQPSGPGIAPVVTRSITFVVPKAAPWWFEMSFPCYAAAIQLQAGNRPSSAFTAVSPMIEPALRAADIDLDHDVSAIGGFGCGDGECIYVALALRHPEKLGDMIGTFSPDYKKLGKGHYALTAPGSSGTRSIEIQAQPLAHVVDVPDDPWAKQAAQATHVIFVTGLFSGTKPIDPMAELADPKAGLARVRDIEGVAADPGGACAIGGRWGKTDFQPGYGLDHARFAAMLPRGSGDALTHLLGSERTLDLEVELVLDKPPSEAVVKQWMDDGRAWLKALADPIRAQYAAQGPMVDVMFRMGAAIGEHGFRHTLKGNTVVFSWKSDRIPASDLTAYEAQLRGALGMLPP